MPDAWGGPQAILAWWGLTYLLHSSVFIVGVWAAERFGLLGGGRPRELVLTVALLGGLLTSLAAFGRGDWDRPPRKAAEMDVTITVMETGYMALPPRAPDLGEGGLPRGDVRGAVWAGAATADSSWHLVLLGLWVGGASLLILSELRSLFALRRIRRRLEPAGARAERALAGVLSKAPRGHAALGLRVRVRRSRDVAVPCVVDSHTVALPSPSADELSDSELLAVLAHEVAHIRRRDVIRQSVFRWIVALFWFQPMNRWVLGRLREVAEDICDDWALGHIARPLDLARSLSRVAGWISHPEAHVPALAGRRGSRLSDRIGRILSPLPLPARCGAVRGILVAVALASAAARLPSVPLPAPAPGVFVLREEVRVVPTHRPAFGVGHDAAPTSGFLPARTEIEVRLLELSL